MKKNQVSDAILKRPKTKQERLSTWDAEWTKGERKENSGSIPETYEEKEIKEYVSTLKLVEKPRRVGTEEN